jgi:hypothetical protein
MRRMKRRRMKRREGGGLDLKRIVKSVLRIIGFNVSNSLKCDRLLVIVVDHFFRWRFRQMDADGQ